MSSVAGTVEVVNEVVVTKSVDEASLELSVPDEVVGVVEVVEVASPSSTLTSGAPASTVDAGTGEVPSPPHAEAIAVRARPATNFFMI
tara:strand:+ start:265 stop:528 length:264 start_codon:yes stop_codon:yes gene_type:complete